jgi:hypothetical protein
VATFGRDELRDEGEEEEGGLGIERFSEDTLAEGAAFWSASVFGRFGIA